MKNMTTSKLNQLKRNTDLVQLEHILDLQVNSSIVWNIKICVKHHNMTMKMNEKSA